MQVGLRVKTGMGVVVDRAQRNRRKCLWLASGFVLALVFIASETLAQTAPVSDAPELLAQAEQHEQAHRWLTAASIYARLLEREPDQTVWREALRRCLTQERIRQRYQDRQLRAWLAKLDFDEALAVYSEFVDYAEHVFVGELTLAAIWRRGWEHLNWALDNPAFAELAFDRAPTAERKQRLREWFAELAAVQPSNKAELLHELRRQARRMQLREQMRPVLTVWECLAAGCEALDAYGEYLTPTAVLLEKLLADPHTATPGLDITATDDGIIILGVAPDSDAARQGLRVGSRLLAIQSESVDQESLEGVWLRLLGRKGTRVAVTVQTEEGETREFLLTRQTPADTVTVRRSMLDSMEGVGYIRVELFQTRTVREFDRALQDLSSQGMRALVLDLRGNRGGLVTAALQVADRFIPAGTLAVVQSRIPEWNHHYLAQRGDDWLLPVVVLVDEKTASAAEMLAGALQAHARLGHIQALVAGQPTRGKAEVQYVLELARGQAGGTRMTAARWLLPNGETVSGRGIQPDVLIKPQLPNGADPAGMMDDPAVQQALDNAVLEIARTQALQLLRQK
jgi:carboxyl-terminal processing protease